MERSLEQINFDLKAIEIRIANLEVSLDRTEVNSKRFDDLKSQIHYLNQDYLYNIMIRDSLAERHGYSNQFIVEITNGHAIGNIFFKMIVHSENASWRVDCIDKLSWNYDREIHAKIRCMSDDLINEAKVNRIANFYITPDVTDDGFDIWRLGPHKFTSPEIALTKLAEYIRGVIKDEFNQY